MMNKCLEFLLVLAILLSIVSSFPLVALADDPTPIVLNAAIQGAFTSDEEMVEYRLSLAKDTKIQISLKAYSSETSMKVVVGEGTYWDDDLGMDVPYDETITIGNLKSFVYPVVSTKTIYFRKGTYVVRLEGKYNDVTVLSNANRFEFLLKKTAEYNHTPLDLLHGNSWDDAYDINLGDTIKGMFPYYTQETKYFEFTLDEPRCVKLSYTMSGYATYFRCDGFDLYNNGYSRLSKPKTLTQTLVLDSGKFMINLNNQSAVGDAFFTLSLTGLSMPKNLLKLPKTITLGSGAIIGEDAARSLPSVYNSKLTKIYPDVTWSLKDSSSALATVTNNTIAAQNSLGTIKLLVTDAVSKASGTTVLKIVPNRYSQNKPSVVKSQKTPQFSLKSAAFDPITDDLKLIWFLYNNTGATIKTISGFNAFVVAGSNDIHTNGIPMQAMTLNKPLKKGAFTTFEMTIKKHDVRDGTELDLTGGFRLDWEGDLYVLTDMGGLKSKSLKADVNGAEPVSGLFMPRIYVPGRR